MEENQILIDYGEEIAKYDLDGKWNDYIAVQKEVLRVLREKGFFTNNIVCNAETGMRITISPKDIRDTFAYFSKMVLIKDINLIIRISVKKKAGSNHFHIHHIDINENSLELLGSSHRTNIFETQDYISKITDN